MFAKMSIGRARDDLVLLTMNRLAHSSIRECSSVQNLYANAPRLGVQGR
jgi:hypothetical protein